MAEVSFGEWLKRQRSGRGLTQQQLAHQIGCAVITLRKIEAEERRPSAQIIERLAEILNIPQAERTNFSRFARGNWSVSLSETPDETPWQAKTTTRTNLPAAVTELIGRGHELAEVREYLQQDEIRLVTLIGPPGIGKTQLSIESARQSLANFADGVFFIALAPLEHPNLVLPTILQTLGFVETKKSSMEQLKEGIGEKQMLFVLDNCEHLIEIIAAVVSDLLSDCPRLKILTTSREALRVTGEWLYAVPPLDVPKEISSVDVGAQFSALTLFAERARAVHPDFTLNAENLSSVASICARLDGLPLAIELIAARLRLMSPQALLERWHDQFLLSAEGMRTASARQKTLSAAIGWSYSLLSEEEQKCFAYLSVFSGGFTLSAAEAIFSQHFTEKSISDLITSLLDKSLLQRSPESHGEVRLTMLVTIQQFALNCLRKMGEEEQVRNWHLAYFLDFAEQADKQMHGPDQLRWIDLVQDELDNIRAALDWCVSDQKAESALRLLTALSQAWIRRDRLHEMRSWFKAIRSLPGITEHPLLYARLLNHISLHSWLLADFEYARSLLEESYAILITLGVEGEPDLATNLYYSGQVAFSSEADIKTAHSYYERSFELYKKYGDQWGMASTLFSLGILASERNEYPVALSLLEQSLELFHQLGDIFGVGRVSQNLGQSFLQQGNFEKARLHFEEHLRIDEGLRFKGGTVVALANLGELYRYQGDYDQAARFYEKSLILSRGSGNPWGTSNNILCLGLVALHRNDYLQARQKFIDYYSLARAMYGGGIAECDLLTAMAAVAAGTNQPERAAKLYGAAQALLETTNYRLQPFDRAEFDQHIRIAQEQLGGAKFKQFMSEGYAMTMETAVAYALGEHSS